MGGDIENGCYEVVGVQRDRVLGGEAAIWSEAVDATNLQTTAWMPVAVVAERLWSSRTVLDVDDAWRRLQRMRSHMAKQGFPGSTLPPRLSDRDGFITSVDLLL